MLPQPAPTPQALQMTQRGSFLIEHLQAQGTRLLQKKSTIWEARSTPLSASDASTAKDRDATKAYSLTSSSAILPANHSTADFGSRHACLVWFAVRFHVCIGC